MDDDSWVITPALCFLSLSLLFVTLLRHLSSEIAGQRKRPPLPPGPRGWPFVGNLWQLGPSPHLTLTDWSTRYGNIYRLRLGSWTAVVLNGLESVREALVKQPHVFSSRPDFDTYRHYADGKSISFSPYSSKFRLHRRVTTGALRKILRDTDPSTEEIIGREADRLVKALLENSHVLIDPRREVTLAIAGVLYSVCFGQDAIISEDDDFRNLLTGTNPSAKLFGAGSQVDLMPWIRYLSKMSLQQECIQHMVKFVILNQAKARQHQRMRKNGRSVRGVMDFMISSCVKLEPKAKEAAGLTDEHLLATTVEFLSAGTETSSSTLLWLILHMAAYPDIQDKVFAEIDQVLGSEGNPVASIRLQLPFTEACILEVMRLVTVVPFGLPHYTTSSAVLNGYHIQKGTLVLVNLWSVGRDSQVWPDPDRFRPDRFLRNVEGLCEVDRYVAGQCLPFGAGRRRCLGEELGRLQVFLMFVRLMQKCRFAADAENFVQPLFGDVLRPGPFKVKITPRL